MQLYRIEYDQLTLVSKFDAKGNLVERTEERVRVSMNDLPLQTVAMYREKMQGLNISVLAQEAAREEPKTQRHAKRYEREETRKTTSFTATPQKTKEERLKEAAQAGDMSAAINMGDK